MADKKKTATSYKELLEDGELAELEQTEQNGLFRTTQTALALEKIAVREQNKKNKHENTWEESRARDWMETWTKVNSMSGWNATCKTEWNPRWKAMGEPAWEAMRTFRGKPGWKATCEPVMKKKMSKPAWRAMCKTGQKPGW